jgi:hypothetical protein
MLTNQERATIYCKKGFIREVNIEHSPHHGFSTAYYKGSIIAQAELGKIREPIGDDDREWEMYEERFDEWRGDMLTILKNNCTIYFNETDD